MKDIRKQWRQSILRAVVRAARERGIDTDAITADDILIQKPPRPEMGDIAVPLFSFAKLFRSAPAAVAAAVIEQLQDDDQLPSGEIFSAGPYVNIRVDTAALAQSLEQEIAALGSAYGRTELFAGRRVMIEFSCPNTNKPLHLGHMRNDALGESVSRILRENGADVQKVNLINDRGVHICKSMLAYQKFGNGETPQSTGIKSDHFVGKYYVKFAQWVKEYPEAEAEAQAMLRKWEDQDPETMRLWKQMNTWTIDGISQTYEKTGISFDDVYYESRTYTKGKSEILKGLEQGVFYQDEEGTVWVDLEPINLDKKVLLRKDGTSLYLTQDIGTAIARHGDWPFDTLIYVVASEQKYHFTVLFYVLSLLGFPWAEHLFHLSYGMVNLPDGKMKSREGTVVDADDLFAQLEQMAQLEIVGKGREEEVGSLERTSSSIALGALNYYLLQVNPTKDMIFDPKESISFNGNTGPYLQYMGARISSMLKKYEQLPEEIDALPFDSGLLGETEERELIKLISSYPEYVRQAGEEMNPSIITSYLFDLSKLYSKFYHDHQILNLEDRRMIKARVTLSKMALQVLENAFALVGIPFLESM